MPDLQLHPKTPKNSADNESTHDSGLELRILSLDSPDLSIFFQLHEL